MKQIILIIFFIITTVGSMHPCERECIEDSPPMTCFYHFKLESYQTLSKACYNCAKNNFTDCLRSECISGDGIRRPITVVNRQLPGPGIRVCLGDKIVVDVENALNSETTSLHWHGHHQRGSPHMDGVPHVTQCPILPGNIFRYTFSADNPGTHFWHSHSGLQRADGVYGSLIIKIDNKNYQHKKLYDTDLKEHEIHITDWLHLTANTKFIAHHHSDGDNKPRSILINGRGRYGNGTFMSNTTTPFVPITIFNVKSGLRHRFRLINSGFLNCPLELSVDNHTLLVIASDGSDLKPIEVDSFVSYAGERFDFILNANQAINNYWLRIRGLMDCDERFYSVHQVAVIAYEGSNNQEPAQSLSYKLAKRRGKQLNSLNAGSNDNDENTITMAEVSSLKSGDINILTMKPHHTFYIGYDFYKKDNPIFHKSGLYGFNQVSMKSERLLTPQFNHISLKLPSTPMIMQNEHLLKSELCNMTSLHQEGKNCKEEFCKCLHRLRVEVGDIIDLVLVDEGVAFNANHPFHLHGHAFHVTAMQRLGENTTISQVRQLLEQKLNYNSLNAPLKDTVTVPDGGFTALRFKASNPGVWLFHCHIGFHVEIGMGFILQVGDWSQFIKAPKGFPTCGNWLPDLINNKSVIDNKPEIMLLDKSQNNSLSDRLLYQIFNISTKSQQNIDSPPVIIVQHTWTNPSKNKNHSSLLQMEYYLILLLLVFINFI